MPGERRQALQLLVKFGIRVLDMTLLHNHGLDEELHRDLGLKEDLYQDLAKMDQVEGAFADLLSGEISASRASGQEHWESELLQQLEDGWDSLYWRWDLLQYDDQEEQYFPRSMELLHERHSRRVADLLAEKVAGHLLPPELIEMVRDDLLSVLVPAAL